MKNKFFTSVKEIEQFLKKETDRMVINISYEPFKIVVKVPREVYWYAQIVELYLPSGPIFEVEILHWWEGRFENIKKIFKRKFNER